MAESPTPRRDTPSSGWTPEIRERLLQLARDQNRETSQKALVELARRTRRQADVLEIFERLAGTPQRGKILALTYLCRLPTPLPIEIRRQALPMLSEKVIPMSVRLTAAGQLLESVPDRPETIRPILQAATRGLSRSRRLEYLIQLQSRVRRCQSLDHVVNQTEASVKLRCPKCPKKLTRTELIRHLWQEHRLLFDHGRALEPRRRLESLIDQAAIQSSLTQQAVSAEALDAVFAAAAVYFPKQPPRRMLQAIAARSMKDRSQLQTLLQEAAELHCGLCPVCLDRIPDPVLPLPGPLNLSPTALQGEGYRLTLSQRCGHRSVTIATPNTAPISFPERPAWSARSLGAILAFPLVCLGMIAACLSSRPLDFALGFTVPAWLVYLAVRFFKPPLPEPRKLLVDRAWVALVPQIGRKPAALRFLIRLCQTSLTEGTPSERMREVWELVDKAALLADRGPLPQQLFAAARVLQVHDAAVEGRERIAGLLSVFEPVFQGQYPLCYIEAASACLDHAPPLLLGDRRRLAIRLTSAAFAAGLFPGDLVAIARFCPRFRHWILPEDPLDLHGLFRLWTERQTRPWQVIGPADTIFDVAATDPVEARTILAAHPDALLRLRLDPRIEAELGPVMISRSGVIIGNVVTANPEIPLNQVKSARGGWELLVGRSRLPLQRKMPAGSLEILRAWIAFRTRTLMPLIEHNPRLFVSARLPGLLSSLMETCPNCRTVSVISSGMLGVRWEEAISGRG